MKLKSLLLATFTIIAFAVCSQVTIQLDSDKVVLEDGRYIFPPFEYYPSGLNSVTVIHRMDSNRPRNYVVRLRPTNTGLGNQQEILDWLQNALSTLTASGGSINLNNVSTNINISNQQPVDNEGTPQTTKRLSIDSWEKSNGPNGHAGDAISLHWRDPSAKPFIGWWDYTGPSPELKGWIGAHDLSNDGLSEHKHLSIETSDASGAMQTRIDFDYDKDTTEIKTSSANFTVGGGHKFRASGRSTFNSTILAEDSLIVLGDTRFEDVVLYGDAGEKRLLAVNSSNTGDYASTLRLTGESSGLTSHRGLYAQYDASGNQAIIGVHNANSLLESDDIEIILIDRDGAQTNITNEVIIDSNLGLGINPTVKLHVNGITRLGNVLIMEYRHDPSGVNLPNGTLFMGFDGAWYVKGGAGTVTQIGAN